MYFTLSSVTCLTATHYLSKDTKFLGTPYVVVVVVVVFIDFYYKVTETFIAIEDLSVLKEEVLDGNIT